MIRILCLSLLLAVAAAGCQSTQYDNRFFDYDPQQSRTRAILDAQYSAGAATDRALTRHHFDGQRLNGLGRDKLDRMIAAGTTDGQVIVHLDLPAGVDPAPMVESVQDYLAASGVPVGDGTVVLAPSPAGASARDSLAAIQRATADAGTPEESEPERTPMATSPTQGLLGDR